MFDDLDLMDVREFRESGFLQEANRLFFHPRGLALVVAIDGDTGKEYLFGITDARNDPEGLVFSDINTDEAREKMLRVEQEYASHVAARMRLLGDAIQPIEGD